MIIQVLTGLGGNFANPLCNRCDNQLKLCETCRPYPINTGHKENLLMPTEALDPLNCVNVQTNPLSWDRVDIINDL